MLKLVPIAGAAILAAAVPALALTGTVKPSENQAYQQQLESLNERFDRAVGERRLSSEQAQRLRTELGSLRVVERQYADDGYSAAERGEFEQRIQNLQRRLRDSLLAGPGDESFAHNGNDSDQDPGAEPARQDSGDDGFGDYADLQLEADAARERDAYAARQSEARAAREREAYATRQRQARAARERDAYAARQREARAARERDAYAARQREAYAARQREAYAVRQREEYAARARYDDPYYGNEGDFYEGRYRRYRRGDRYYASYGGVRRSSAPSGWRSHYQDSAYYYYRYDGRYIYEVDRRSGRVHRIFDAG